MRCGSEKKGGVNMKEGFVAGIDGGGTKTTVVCESLMGENRRKKTFGPFNMNSIGEEGFVALLRELTAFFGAEGQCRALCIGAAGSSSPRMRTLMETCFRQAGISKWRLAGDHEIALAGALKGRPGCVLVAGTGSICYGRNGSGETCRAGGWGHLIGDEGSGYALGRDALTAAARWYDGYGEATGLVEGLARDFQLSGRQEIISYAYGGDKSRIAALAPLVEKEAAAGDPVAARILKKNAEALMELVKAVTGKLRIREGEVALLGGLLTADTGLKRAFLAGMEASLSEIRCIAPKEPPEIGAVMLAREMLE